MIRGPGFRIIDGRGFHITLPNNYTLSVQFGAGNYCSNYNESIVEEMEQARLGKLNRQSPDAEIAAWAPDGKWVTRDIWQSVFGKSVNDDVVGRVGPAEVVELLCHLRGLS